MYPWGDMHSLNLGWFLLQFKDWVEKIQEYLDNGGGTSENLANVIAPVFNAENSYLTGDYVLYNDELYKALEPVPAGTWNPDAWERCLVTEEMGSGSGGVDNVARLMIAGQYSNTYNYRKYAICRYADKLWMCNTNIPTGGEEWEPSHWDEITVGAGLTGLRRSVETLVESINDLQDIVGNGSLTGFAASDLTGAANELKGSFNSIQGQITANVETSATASKAYAVGEYLVLNGTLYKVIAAIANGATITPNTNVIATSATREGYYTTGDVIKLEAGFLTPLCGYAQNTTALRFGIPLNKPIIPTIEWSDYKDKIETSGGNQNFTIIKEQASIIIPVSEISNFYVVSNSLGLGVQIVTATEKFTTNTPYIIRTPDTFNITI